MINPLFYGEGFRILLKSSERRINGIKKYEGSAGEVCRQVVNSCWNSNYFMTSNGNYQDFWSRDFGWCSEALCRHGWRSKVRKTLNYALSVFKQFNKVTTTINPKGVPFDYPVYAIDSLPWLVRALRNAKDNGLINNYSEFIEEEAEKVVKKIISPRTSLAKPYHYSSIKDYAVRKSSTYDNVMIAMLKDDLDVLGLKNPLIKFNVKEAILKHLWTGEYFRNDLSDDAVSSDANIFPFITGVFTNKGMLDSSINSLLKAGLDKPVPIKFSVRDVKTPTMYYLFVRNYQGTTVWTHMGPLFIKLMKQINSGKANEYKKEYKGLIEKYGNYLEVLNSDLTPFQTKFYMSDESILWAVNYLDL